MQKYNTYVALDLETTGLSIRKRKIIEVAALKVFEGEIKDSIQMLVYPQVELEPRITELTGISNEMLRGQRSIRQILPEILDFIGEDVLLGHSILFDYSFLKKEAIQAGLDFAARGIDTLEICKKLLPADYPKSLASACSYFGIAAEGGHRAYNDTYHSHLLYQALLKEEADASLYRPEVLRYRHKKERAAGKAEKEYLRKLLKYHKIKFDFDIDELSLSELSRTRDKIILEYGYIK